MRKSVRLKLLDTLVRAASLGLIGAGAVGAFACWIIGGWGWLWFPVCLLAIAIGLGLFAAWPYENEEVGVD